MHWATLPDTRAAENPAEPCISNENITLSNQGFLDSVEQFAAVLRARGIGSGDVVAIKLPNRIELVIAMFASWRLGATVTPMNPSFTSRETEHQLTDSGAELLIQATAQDTSQVAVDELYLPVDTGYYTGTIPVDPHSVALLIYTSGTTGKPKGVMLEHANLLDMCTMFISAMHLSASDHCLLILPLFHINGIMVSTLSPLLSGARTTIVGKFSPRRFFDIVERVRPTYFAAVPTMYTLLLELPESVRPDTSSLRAAVCGAAPMPAKLITEFESRYQVPIIEGYGLSEGTCTSAINPIDGMRKPGTVGLPLPGQDVAIMAPTGNILPRGKLGEVVVRGPNVMRGYLNKPEQTSETIVSGWLHTGDIGTFDEDGYLILVDRIKDMIIRGGENIYPKEIEAVLYANDLVREVAVVGAADPVYGEVPIAFIVLREGANIGETELGEHCARSLAKYKLPVEFVFVDTIPKNPVGKIDKPALRAGLSAPQLPHWKG